MPDNFSTLIVAPAFLGLMWPIISKALPALIEVGASTKSSRIISIGISAEIPSLRSHEDSEKTRIEVLFPKISDF